MRRTILLAGVLPFVSAFLGGVLAFSVAIPTFVEAQEARIRAEQLTIVGDNGADRVRLRTGPGIASGVQVLDANGQQRVLLQTGAPRFGGAVPEESAVVPWRHVTTPLLEKGSLDAGNSLGQADQVLDLRLREKKRNFDSTPTLNRHNEAHSSTRAGSVLLGPISVVILADGTATTHARSLAHGKEERMETATARETSTSSWEKPSTYEQWITGLRVPVHRGYYVEDLRTVEVGWWEERGCNAAILLLAGQEGVSEVRVSEIPPGHTTTSFCMAVDEMVYVLEGRGLTAVWAEGRPAKTFEWQKHSLFLLPRHHFHQLSNAQGERPARLLHYNALPIAMTALPDPDFFFNRPYPVPEPISSENGGLYSEAKLVHEPHTRHRGTFWRGNFFPDMRAWDKLLFHEHRGAGGQVVWVQYPNAPMWNHMSVFSDRTYKKGHRHGPGTLIVIVEGEGYSYLWEEGKEKILIPWHEASVTVPPDRWYHQHFNVGAIPARYLAFHSPRANQDYQRRLAEGSAQIEYADEDPIIRKTFEEELARRGLKSLMPEQVYVDRNFEWEEPQGGD